MNILGAEQVMSIAIDNEDSQSGASSSISSCSTQYLESSLTVKVLQEYLNAKSPSLTLKNPEKVSSQCWKYFQFVYFENKKQEFVYCKTCQKFLAHRKRSGTSHLSNHVCCKPLVVDKKTPANPTITQHFGGKTLKISEKKLVEEAQAVCIARDLRPLGFTEGAGFLQLANALIQVGSQAGPIKASRVLASRFVITNRVIPNLVKEAKEALRAGLSELLLKKRVNFTADHWRSPTGENYMVITGHAMNENFDLKSYVIGSFHQEETKTGN